MYRFFADVVRDEDPWMPTLGLSSALLSINIIVAYGEISKYTSFGFTLTRVELIFGLTIIAIINYFLNFRTLSFLSYDFDFDLKAFITLILYIALSFALIILLR